jgi:RNA polymerase sigma-70 factor (ECF subfamily)
MDAELIRPEQMIPGPSPDLLDRVKAGDQAAFGTLVRQYQTYAYALAMRFVWDRAEAEDIVQESFVRVWRHIGSYRVETRLTTWLYAIVTRSSIDRIRRIRRREKLEVRSDDADRNPDDAGAPDLHNDLHNAQLVEAIGRLVEHLAPTQRVVFTLRDLQDMPMEEIALITGMSAENVKANLWHARHRMRELLVRTGMIEKR